MATLRTTYDTGCYSYLVYWADPRRIWGWILHDFADTPQIRCSPGSIQIRMGDLNVSWTELVK